MIFSRRAIQDRLTSLSSLLEPQQSQDLIDRLDGPARGRLPAVWEAVWLDALSRLTSVVHERPLEDGSKPDFQLRLQVGDTSVPMVGDITAASDKGLNDNNPIDQFWNEIVRLARKYKLNPNHFYFSVGHRRVGEYRDEKMVLALPSRANLREVLKVTAEPFILALSKGTAESTSLPYTKGDVQFTISYNTSQEFSGGSYISYATPYSHTKNPLHTALEKKSGQLRAAPHEAIRLVILCDAGCHVMQHPMPMGGALSAVDVVTEYLKRSSTIDAVALVTVKTEGSIMAGQSAPRLSQSLILPPNGHRSSRLTDAVIQAMSLLVNGATKLLPVPVVDARNALHRFERPSFYTRGNGYRMSSNNVALSSRLVLELLAGTKTVTDLEQAMGWDRDGNPFTRLLAKGQLINQASLTDGGDADDDWLDLHFNDGDPAISMFTSGRK